MFLDIEVYITLLSTDITKRLKEQFIYMTAAISVKTSTGKQIYGKLDINPNEILDNFSIRFI